MPKVQAQVRMRKTAYTGTTADDCSSTNAAPSDGASADCETSYASTTNREGVHTKMQEFLQQTNKGLWVGSRMPQNERGLRRAVRL